MKKKYLFLSFGKYSKESDGSLLVPGTVTSEAVDSDGDIVTFEAAQDGLSEENWPWRNIREMHQPIAAGTALEIVPNEAERSWDVVARISAASQDAQTKVLDETYKGFSLGFDVPAGFYKRELINGEMVGVCHKIKVHEISLVDAPANPTCKFKIANSEKEDSVRNQVPDEKAAAPKDAPPAADPAKPEENAKADDAAEPEMKIEERLKALECAVKAMGEKAAGDEPPANDGPPAPPDKKAPPVPPAPEKKAVGDAPAPPDLGAIAEAVRSIGEQMAAIHQMLTEAVSQDAAEEGAEEQGATPKALSLIPSVRKALSQRAKDSKAMVGVIEKVTTALESVASRLNVLESEPNLPRSGVRTLEKSLSSLGIKPENSNEQALVDVLQGMEDGQTVGDLRAKMAFAMTKGLHTKR